VSGRRDEFTVGDRPSVDVNVKSGSVSIRSATSGRIAVDIDAADRADWLVAANGDLVTIEPPRGRLWTRSARVFVEVPAGADVDVRAASADVSLVGSFGTSRIRVASGDVDVGSVERLDATSASGQLRVDAATSDAACRTASGDVEVGSVDGRLSVTTASGDVRVARASDDVEISTATGDVRVGRYDGSDLVVKTTTGRVAVGLPSGIRVQPDLSTLSGHTRLPAPSSDVHHGDRRVVRVSLRTISGDIDITRA
jgi:DUF4097 and DUF4098 domain-containing protein YvlB